MYRIVPINQTSDIRLIDRFYMFSSYDIDITLHGKHEVASPCRPSISTMHMFGYLLSIMCRELWVKIQARKQVSRDALLGVVPGVQSTIQTDNEYPHMLRLHSNLSGGLIQ